MKKTIVLIALLVLGIGSISNYSFVRAENGTTGNEDIASIDINAFLADEANPEIMAGTDYSDINDPELLQAILDELNLRIQELTAQINALES